MNEDIQLNSSFVKHDDHPAAAAVTAAAADGTGTSGDIVNIPCRVTLYLLSLSGFLVSFMMRNDINIAIVAMVRNTPSPPTNNSGSILYCYEQLEQVEQLESNRTARLFIKNSYQQEQLVPVSNNNNGHDDDDVLDWSRDVQNIVIACFYVSYVISQLVGGLATQIFGTKQVFGFAQLFTACSSLLIPTAASFHYGAVIGLRSVQGFASGLTWPAMYAIVNYWIPVSERSRFMSSFQGFSIGIGLTYPLCGLIIAWCGWRFVFYTTGSIGLIWCAFWYALAFDTPEKHPRIAASERAFIVEHRTAKNSHDLYRNVPWKAIFTSAPAWAIGLTTFGRIWVSYTFITHGPMYMKDILGFNIKENGFLNGAPFISSYFSAVLFCYVADKLHSRKLFTLTTIRKIFTALAQVIPGLMVLLIGWLECRLVYVLIVWFIAVSFITAAYAGAMANIVDIAPNFAGPVLAFAQTIHMTASFLSPLAAGFLIREQQTLETYKHVFYLSAFVSIVTYLVYQVWGTGEIQAWNEGDSQTKRTNSEA